MKMIPDEELKTFEKVQWAPMVDFLFIVIIVFATIAITRNVVTDRELRLASALKKDQHAEKMPSNTSQIVNLSINHKGEYKWLSESKEIYFESAKQVGERLLALKNQHELPAQAKQVKILLHIDKTAPWQPIADVIFAVRESGYDVHPVYQSSRRRL